MYWFYVVLCGNSCVLKVGPGQHHHHRLGSYHGWFVLENSGWNIPAVDCTLYTVHFFTNNSFWMNYCWARFFTSAAQRTDRNSSFIMGSALCSLINYSPLVDRQGQNKLLCGTISCLPVLQGIGTVTAIIMAHVTAQTWNTSRYCLSF